ncbi:FAD-binding protein [Desulfobacterales bacterium HSG17]|nr:FAD-binding protein [Desulfobacterales bacterium HSG17]
MATEKPETKIIETDVLIIGGGSAGCMAAIAAHDAAPNLNITILEKAHTRRSGTLATGMDALNVVAVPGLSTPEDYVKGVDLDHTHGVIDEDLHYVLAKKSFAMLKKLEGWGVGFEKDDTGQYVGTPNFYNDCPGDKFCIPMAGLDLKLILSREVKKRKIKVVNHTITTSLLSDSKKVYGACGFNIRTGKFIACSAKAVILAAGGCGRFGMPSSGYMYGTFDFPGNAGDGYSMAYRAGAKLRGFEYAQHFAETKRLNVPLGKEYDSEFDTKMVNEMGEDVKIHEGSDDDNVKALLSGQTMYESFSHLPEEIIKQIEEIWFASERKHPIISFFKERKMDIRKDPVEVGFEEIALCSGHGSTGIKVDTDTATSVKGLYACGDVACVPSQYLTGAFVYGEIAGQSAVEFAKQCDTKKIDHETIQNQAEMIFVQAKRTDGIKPNDFELKVRTIITQYLTPPRSAEKLKTALKWIKRFRKEDVDCLKVEDWHELSKAVEVQFILDCAEMTARASLKRNETRWGVSDYRSDFPQRDDENWLKFVDLEMDCNSGEMVVSASPVKRRENKDVK